VPALPNIKQAPKGKLDWHSFKPTFYWPNKHAIKAYYEVQDESELLEPDGSFEYHVELHALIFIPSTWLPVQTPMAARAT
jgi:hypothetical protein